MLYVIDSNGLAQLTLNTVEMPRMIQRQPIKDISNFGCDFFGNQDMVVTKAVKPAFAKAYPGAFEVETINSCQDYHINPGDMIIVHHEGQWEFIMYESFSIGRKA